MSKRLDHVETARKEAESLGATFSWKQCKNNITGVIYYNGKSRKLFMSISPSDWRVHGKIIKNVRDYIKEMSN